MCRRGGVAMPASPLPALVADDTAVARAAVVRALKAHKTPFVEASSATAAKAHDATQLACALLDLDLGDGTGVEVARALRAKRQDLPIAFFTAGAPAAVVDDARTLGPVFQKPGDLDRAVRWIVQHATA
jgi:CheY-like chemotaxis protein